VIVCLCRDGSPERHGQGARIAANSLVGCDLICLGLGLSGEFLAALRLSFRAPGLGVNEAVGEAAAIMVL